MSDISKITEELMRAQRRYQMFELSPTARILAEAQTQHRMQLLEISRCYSAQMNEIRSITSGFARQIASVEADMRAVVNAISPSIKMLEQGPWKKLLGPESPLTQYRARIAEISAAYSQVSIRLRSIASLPSIVAGQHAAMTYRMCESWEEAGRRLDPLVASVAASEGIVEAQEPDILEYPEVIDLSSLETEEDYELAGQPVLNLFHVQRTELIWVARTSPAALEDETVLDTLPSVEYFNAAQSVCRLVTLINRQREARGEEPIFKLTSRLVESLITLPNLIANSRQLLGDFIDCLNFVLYEGAGKDNLRFLGLISDDDAAPIWAIKHFRNYDLRHDVDHGKATQVTKKLKELAADYQSLIGIPVPRKRQDYRRVQLQLVKRIEQMLRRVSDAIEALPPPETQKD